MTGFPNRPDLSSFGPDAVNTRAIRDPSRELSADTFNLIRHQIAGLGAVLPRAFIKFRAQPSPVLLGRAEAWNPRGLTSAPFLDPTLARSTTGVYTVLYSSPVTDKDGASVALSFTWGIGMVINASTADELWTCQVTPLSGFANAVQVGIFNAAGALTDGRDVALLLS